MKNKISLYPERSQNIEPASHIPPFSEVHLGSPTLLSWWYSFTAPEAPSPYASFTERENVRRGRLLSLLVLLITLIVLLAAPVAIYTKNMPMLTSLLSALLFNAITLWFNRRGHVMIAGLLTIIPMTLGFTFGQILTPGGMTIDNVRIFDLLVASDLLVVSLFRPASVFIAATANSILIWAILSFAPHSAELDQLLAANRYGIILLPILIQFVVALPAYLLTRSTYQALLRADRAEELTALTQQNVELQQREIERTQQVTQGIEHILAAMVRFANGDIQARAPESQENVLWRIGRSLNTLLARQKDYHRKIVELEQARKRIDELQARLLSTPSTQSEFQRTREAAIHLQNAIKIAGKRRTLIPLPPPSGTIIDEIAMELQVIQSR